jgi:DNA repair exonuclease SbcCD ATPase subunit
MHLKRAKLSNFTSHTDSTFELPDSGLVVVTGNNGAGKSSLTEAVAWALWGKTLRGTDPVPPGEVCTAEIELDAVSATRSKKHGGRASFSWMPNSGEQLEFENNTKAKQAIEEVIGDISVWRRTAVFSSHDAAHFTMASDGERKRLLESILGIDKFDKALAQCREDLRLKKSEIRTLEADVSILQTRIPQLLKLKNDLSDAIHATRGTYDDPRYLESKIAQLRKACSAYDDEIKELKQNELKLTGKLTGFESKAVLLKRKKRLLEQDKCPTCERDFGKSDKKRLYTEILNDSSFSEQKSILQNRDLLIEECFSLADERMEVVRCTSKLEAELRTVRRLAPERAKLKESLAEAEVEAKNCVSESAKVTLALGKARAAAAKLSTCAKVLGLKGVRAQVITAALAGLEAAANAWLARIAGAGLSLEVRPYSETSKGVSDAISLDIQGAGGGNGYKATSGGERRRLDIAVMLALSEIAAAAANKSPGTLFFDEVLDALDQDGIEAVVVMLADLAKDRAVVVITHSKTLADVLSSRQKVHWHVKRGDPYSYALPSASHS